MAAAAHHARHRLAHAAPGVGDQAASLDLRRPPGRAPRPGRCRSRDCAGARRAAPWSRWRPRTAPRSAPRARGLTSVASALPPASSAAPVVSIQPSFRRTRTPSPLHAHVLHPGLALDPLERLERIRVLAPMPAIAALASDRSPRCGRRGARAAHGARCRRRRDFLEVVKEVLGHEQVGGRYPIPCTSRGSNPDQRRLRPSLSPIKALVLVEANVRQVTHWRVPGKGQPVTHFESPFSPIVFRIPSVGIGDSERSVKTPVRRDALPIA